MEKDETEEEMAIDAQPFGGLIPSTIKGEVLAQIVADPFAEYTPKQMAYLVDRAPSRVSEALKELEEIGILENVSHGSHRPVFVTKGNSKRLTALTFLALAVGDDSTGDECMDIAIIDYVQNSLGLKVINPSGRGESVAKVTGPSSEVDLKLPYSAARELASALAYSISGANKPPSK